MKIENDGEREGGSSPIRAEIYLRSAVRSSLQSSFRCFLHKNVIRHAPGDLIRSNPSRLACLMPSDEQTFSKILNLHFD